MTVVASTPEEALQCIRAQYGEAALDSAPEAFTFAVNCAATGCSQHTYFGRDADAAQSCLEASLVGCEVSDDPCP
jgi:hypothetical protein